MKKGLKFVNATLFLSAFGVCFMKLMNIIVFEFSLIDILKISFGKIDLIECLGIDVDIMSSDMRQIGMFILAFLFFMFLGAILSLFLRGNAPYIIGILFAIIDAGLLGFSYFFCVSRLKQMIHILKFVGQSGNIYLYVYVWGIWFAIFALIFVISIVGLFIKNKAKAKKVSRSNVEEEYITKIQQLKQEKLAAAKVFYGAIVAVSGEYRDLVYELKPSKTTEIYLENGHLIFSENRKKFALARISFDGKEYQVEPMEKRTVFMKSGQPLGEEREYFLPRGTEIYIKQKENSFRLA